MRLSDACHWFCFYQFLLSANFFSVTLLSPTSLFSLLLLSDFVVANVSINSSSQLFVCYFFIKKYLQDHSVSKMFYFIMKTKSLLTFMAGNQLLSQEPVVQFTWTCEEWFEADRNNSWLNVWLCVPHIQFGCTGTQLVCVRRDKVFKHLSGIQNITSPIDTIWLNG